MINEEKVKIMDRLAVYEKQEGRKYLPVSKYYRSDYIGLALIKNFFLVTIGYGLILAVIAAYNLEYLLDNVHKMDLISLGVVVLGGYIGILVLYSNERYAGFGFLSSRRFANQHNLRMFRTLPGYKSG